MFKMAMFFMILASSSLAAAKCVNFSGVYFSNGQPATVLQITQSHCKSLTIENNGPASIWNPMKLTLDGAIHRNDVTPDSTSVSFIKKNQVTVFIAAGVDASGASAQKYKINLSLDKSGILTTTYTFEPSAAQPWANGTPQNLTYTRLNSNAFNQNVVPGYVQTQYGLLPQGSCTAGFGQYGGLCMPSIQMMAGQNLPSAYGNYGGYGYGYEYGNGYTYPYPYSPQK